MGCGWYADIFHPHGGSSVAFREHNLLRIPSWRRFRLWREKRYREHARVEQRQMADPRAVVVAVSAMVAGHLRTLHDVPEERIRLIPNGVDTVKFSPAHRERLRGPERRRLGVSDDETVFLMVAHNLKLKNAEAAIRALAAVVARGFRARLVIAGGKRPKPFAALARKLGLEPLVHFVEPADDVRSSYAAADACIHPTWYDPCSLVALEALSSGLPLVTTRFNGVSELMNHGVEGFLLDDPADIPGLAECLVSLTNPAVRQAMGEAARRLALGNTLQQQTGRFLSLYEEIAARKGSASCR
jgi:UDP-glucose:(heptosyl)LPS alpha-1,3-glucosyltransferase